MMKSVYNPKLLLVGNGNIGRHVLNEFNKYQFVVYDKYQSHCCDERVLQQEYDIAFVAVPTEMLPDGQCDLACINDAVPRIKAKVIVVKSAVPVGTFDNYPDNIIISPEFYGTTQHSLEFPNFVILGGRKDKAQLVAQLYNHIKTGDFRIIFTDQHTAELVKYMENCWIATKVTFCNEFGRIAKKVGVNYEELRECFIADERVSPSHTFVYDEQPYYDSHCLNKDIPALINYCQKQGMEVPFMNGVFDANKKQKAEYLSTSNK